MSLINGVMEYVRDIVGMMIESKLHLPFGLLLLSVFISATI